MRCRKEKHMTHFALVRESRLMRSVAPWSEWKTRRIVSTACAFVLAAAGTAAAHQYSFLGCPFESTGLRTPGAREGQQTVIPLAFPHLKRL